MFTIYGAISSREPTVIRYVGCTRDVAVRLYWLVATASGHPGFRRFEQPVTRWLADELGAGYDFRLVPLAHAEDLLRAHQLELGYWQALKVGGRLLNRRRPGPGDLVPMWRRVSPAVRRAAARKGALKAARTPDGRFARVSR